MSLDERNAVLNQKIEGSDLNEAVTTLVKDAAKRKRQVRLLTISIILDLLLTIGLGFLSIQTRSITNKAETNTDAIVRSCEANNANRANNKELWTSLLTLPPTQPRSPERDQQFAAIQKIVDKTFVARDCNTLTN